MRAGGIRFDLSRNSMTDGKGAYIVVPTSALAPFRKGDEKELISTLWDMYFGGEPRSLVSFEDVLKGLVEYHYACKQRRKGD